MEKYYKEFNYKKKTINKENKTINSNNEYYKLIDYNYTIKEIKELYEKFNIKFKSNLKKKELLNNLTNILFLNAKMQIIHKCWRNYFIRCFNSTLGPCYINRSLSNNIEDFLTTDEIKEIDYYYFFSFKDKDNFYYSFNLVSLILLLSKNDTKNPYNRLEIPNDVIIKLKNRIRYNIILNKTSELNNYNQSPLTLDQKIINLFHKIDLLGNYTQSSWFLELNSSKILIFIRELYDIWIYRAQLSQETKIQICPPNGNPFYNISSGLLNNSLSLNNIGIDFLKGTAYVILVRLVTTARDDVDKNMGALYILSALTIVSENARDAMPWLYASVY